MKIKKRLNPLFEEVEVELPIYLKSESIRCHFIKIYSEKKSLWVTVGGHASIGICDVEVSNTTEYVPCTPAEFYAAYDETMTILNSKL